MARLLKFLNLNGLEDLVQFVVFSPVFSIFELLEGFLGYKTTCAQVAPVSCQCPAAARIEIQSWAYSSVSSSWLAALPAAAGV
jgi:hypothetical protein